MEISLDTPCRRNTSISSKAISGRWFGVVSLVRTSGQPEGNRRVTLLRIFPHRTRELVRHVRPRRGDAGAHAVRPDDRAAYRFSRPFSIGLASYLAVLEGLWLATGRQVFLDLFQYWVKIFAVGFAMGVVSGPGDVLRIRHQLGELRRQGRTCRRAR